MSVKATSTETELTLVLDNGDRKIFERVKKDWKFKDEESLVRFAMVVLSESYDKQTVAYPESDGNLKKVKPRAELLTEQDLFSNLD